MSDNSYCPGFRLIPGVDTALSILILRKETLIVNTPSPQVKLKLLAEFRDCIDTAASRKFIQIWVAFFDLNRAFQSPSGQKTHSHHPPFQASRDQSPRLFHHHHQTDHLFQTPVDLGVRQCVGFRLVIASTQTIRGFRPLHKLGPSITRSAGPLPPRPNRWRNGDFHQNYNFRTGPVVLYRNSHPIH